MTATPDPGGPSPGGLPTLPGGPTRRGEPPTSWSRGAVVLALVAATGASACTTASASFTPAFETREAVIGAALDALWQRDVERLKSLAVSESEFRKYVWPELPQVRAGVGGSVEYWWADLQTRSAGSLTEILREFGGRKFALQGVVFDGKPADYGAFRLHRKARLTVRDEQGAVEVLRLFGSLIESSSGCKIYSYVID
jgi:hypothetical protein